MIEEIKKALHGMLSVRFAWYAELSPGSREEFLAAMAAFVMAHREDKVRPMPAKTTEQIPPDMNSDQVIMNEVARVGQSDLIGYIQSRAAHIVSQTQGESWDDTEEWMVDAAELAHAVVRLLALVDIDL